jgi:hypothetical protein
MKRARTDSSAGGKPFNVSQWLAVKSARAFPYKEYGRKVYKRGTPEGVAKYGTSYRSATPMQRQQREMDGIIGSGAYSFGSVGRALGARAGRYIGNKLGPTGLGDLGAVGQKLGKLAGGAVGNLVGMKIMGHGAYQTNSLFQGGMGVPEFVSQRDETGALHITHSEYVQDILGTASFTNSVFPINPGDPAVFPWLSQIAANYDEYEFGGLVFTYRTVTTDLTTSSAQLGTVIMATNYNSGAAPFTTKQSMMEYDGAARVKISEDLMCGVECDKSKLGLGGNLFVALNGTVPASEDIKTYIQGNFQIATNQCVATGQIGELWVSYKVTLRKPKFAVGVGLQCPTSNLVVTSNASICNQTTGVATNAGSFTCLSNFNNLEDVDYTGTGRLPTSSQQVSSSGLANAITVASQSRIGWAIGYGSQQAFAQYTFPPWLQGGTFQITWTITQLGKTTPATPVCAISSGITLLKFEYAQQTVATERPDVMIATVQINSSFAGSGVTQFIQFNMQATTITYLNSANSVSRCAITQINNQVAAITPPPAV